ncbi:Uncharacterised protein [uncultured archaeon]|nr:Uncharacterised protein [uncultured archaeon]
MKRLFLKLKPAGVLLLLKDSQQVWYPSKLAREAKISYVHTVNLLAHLRRLNIATVEKKGKQNIYKLTEKGAYLASALDDFAKKCDAADAEAKAAHAKAAEAAAKSSEAAPQATATEQKLSSHAKSEDKRDAEKK